LRYEGLFVQSRFLEYSRGADSHAEEVYVLAEQRSDGFMEDGYSFAGYQVYDVHYGKIGKVDDIFVDENDNPEYIRREDPDLRKEHKNRKTLVEHLERKIKDAS
jgi:hypothetical protein